MKKLFTLMSLLAVVFFASCEKPKIEKKSTTTETSTTSTTTSETPEKSTTGDITQEGYMNGQGGVTVGEDIINEDARYVYFYSKTCGHCQELNKYLSEHNMYDTVPLEKLEVSENRANSERFLALAKELGNLQAGVPFIYDKVEKKYVVGTPDSIKMLTSYKAGESTNNDEEEVVEENKVEVEEPTTNKEVEENTAEIDDTNVKGNLVDDNK